MYSTERVDYEQKERDRVESSRNVGLYSCLGADVCQYCGSDFGMVKVWDNPEDITDDGHSWVNCPECNPKGDK